jgi:hypothetical protein
MSVNEIEPPKAQGNPKHGRALSRGDDLVTVTTFSPLARCCGVLRRAPIALDR